MDTVLRSDTTAAIERLATAKQKIDQLLSLNKISAKDIEGLNQPERELLAETCAETVRNLTGVARDKFLDRIELIIHATTNSDIWERNHSTISKAIARFVDAYGAMPTKNAIAEDTGLSRHTVAKHLKDYKMHPEHLEEMEQLKFLAPRVLANVFKVAVKGDTKAARLYFEMVGAIGKPQTGMVINEQNNYIQINNTILSQENLNQLTAEQLNQIENIITKQVGRGTT